MSKNERSWHIFEHAIDPILVEDLDGTVIDLNQEAVRVYGWPKDELIGRPIKTIVPDEAHAQADELLHRCRGGEEVRNVEGVRVTRDGLRHPVLLTLSLLRDEHGDPAAIATFCKDVSALKRAQLRHQQLARMFFFATDPVIMEDLDGRILEMNQAAMDLYGFSIDELRGKPIKRLVPDEAHGQADELLQRCLAGETVRDVRGLRQTKAGEVLPVLLTLSLVPGEEGEAAYVASFAKSIVELVESQDALEKLNAELEARVAARTADLAAANERLAHELEVARELSRAAARPHLVALLGNGTAVTELRRQVGRYAGEEEPLLLRGPDGAGHEAIARAVHAASPRAEGPFIYVDCAHFATSEDTLFGHRDGDRARRGKARLARGGTLYLEHADTLPAGEQAALADELAATPGPDGARVIVGVAGDYAEALREHRVDPLLDRALPHRIQIPSLVERRDDIPVIAEHIVSARAQSRGKIGAALTSDSLDRLAAYDWPGNLVELEALLERVVVRATSPSIEIPDELLDAAPLVGGYRLETRLGVGGMGEVWRARHALLARPAAVKLIRNSALAQTEGAALPERFEREARVTAQLRSPHTIELYDFGVTDDGAFYYVMEFIDGIDLDAMVQTFGRLPIGRVLYFLDQACTSLHEAHELGLVHRDVKPSNLFVGNLGVEYDFLKVLDFGIVRQVHSAENARLTQTGTVTGTPETVSPEVLLGEPADRRADIYGLGCVAHYLLTGRLVFNAPTTTALFLKHLTAKPPPLSELLVHTDPRLEQLVLACLAKEPGDRPQTTLELRKELRRLQEDHPWDEVDAATWWERHIAPLRKDASRKAHTIADLVRHATEPTQIR